MTLRTAANFSSDNYEVDYLRAVGNLAKLFLLTLTFESLGWSSLKLGRKLQKSLEVLTRGRLKDVSRSISTRI